MLGILLDISNLSNPTKMQHPPESPPKNSHKNSPAPNRTKEKHVPLRSQNTHKPNDKQSSGHRSRDPKPVRQTLYTTSPIYQFRLVPLYLRNPDSTPILSPLGFFVR